MTVKSKLDPETKIELLIKLAFGIPMNDLIEEYQLSSAKIINLRKNNYLKYNEFFEYWKIDKEVAVLGLTPKYERALSVVKKFYKSKIKINSINSILYPINVLIFSPISLTFIFFPLLITYISGNFIPDL